MENMIQFVHERIKKNKYENGIDFTMGNGHDTLFLSDYCKHVYSYDIQRQAFENTTKLVEGKDNISLYLKSHEFFDEDVESFDVGVFNLGYLPGGDHTITTDYHITLKTVKKALNYLSKNGCLYVVVYVRHDHGEEGRFLDEYFSSLEHQLYNVAKFEMLNKEQAPYVVIVEKRG